MAIKQPVKTIEEAFNNSCKKNGISVRKKKNSKKCMPIMDENGDVYILSEDLSIKKRKEVFSQTKKKGYAKSIPSLENPAKILQKATTIKGKENIRKKESETKKLVKV